AGVPSISAAGIYARLNTLFLALVTADDRQVLFAHLGDDPVLNGGSRRFCYSRAGRRVNVGGRDEAARFRYVRWWCCGGRPVRRIVPGAGSHLPPRIPVPCSTSAAPCGGRFFWCPEAAGIY